eukprot:5061695-Amphidinium_carterae.1
MHVFHEVDADRRVAPRVPPGPECALASISWFEVSFETTETLETPTDLGVHFRCWGEFVQNHTFKRKAQ